MIDEVIGTYRITGLLTRGGMGEIYHGRHVDLPREVVVKTIWLDDFPAKLHDELKKRFRREALIQAQLDHPHIVRVYEFIPAAENYYLVMEYVDGVSLADLIGPGPLNPQRALPIFKQALAALDYAHHRFSYQDESGCPHTGIIHRDIKPANLLLDHADHLKLTDFGIVKLKDEGAGGLTRTGAQPGTINYMSPEQLRPDEELDHRSDLYSLGVTLYESLNGRLPLERARRGGHLELVLPPLRQVKPEIDSELSAIVERALSHKREERFQTAHEFLNELQNYERRLADPFATSLVGAATSPPIVPAAPAEKQVEPPTTPTPDLAGARAETTEPLTPQRREPTAPMISVARGPTPIIISVPPSSETDLPVQPRPQRRRMATLALILVLLAGLAWWYRTATARIEAMRCFVEYQTPDGKTARTSGAEPLPAETELALHFQPRAAGYLYLIAPRSKGNIPITILTTQPGSEWGVKTNRLDAAADYIFPLTVERGPNTITVIFSAGPLTNPAFFTQPGDHALTAAEQMEMANFRRHAAVTGGTEARSQETIVTMPAAAAAARPLLFDLTLTGR